MPSTYSDSLRLELIGPGEKVGTWGTTTNTNLGTILDKAIAGYVAVTTTSANQALTVASGADDQARAAALQLNTSTGANFNVYAPPVSKVYVVLNASATYTATLYNSTTTGGTTAAGAGVSIPPGSRYLVVSNGVNFSLVGDAGATTNTPNTLVKRDASGNFSAGTVTASLIGNVTGDVTGNVSGNAGTVTNGVYTTGDQTIDGVKTFSSSPVVPAGATGSQAPRAEEVVPKVGGAARIPSWTTEGRPGAPSAGDMGLNTTLGRLEVWSNNRWEWQGARQLAALTLNGQTAVTTDITAGLSELEIICPAVSHNSGTLGGLRVRVGPTAGVLTTGYTAGWQIQTGASITIGTATTSVRGGDAVSTVNVSYHFKARRLTGNLWWFSSNCVRADSGSYDGVSGYIDVGGDLTKLELALTNGGAFDQPNNDAGKAYIYGSF